MYYNNLLICIISINILLINAQYNTSIYNQYLKMRNCIVTTPDDYTMYSMTIAKRELKLIRQQSELQDGDMVACALNFYPSGLLHLYGIVASDKDKTIIFFYDGTVRKSIYYGLRLQNCSTNSPLFEERVYIGATDLCTSPLYKYNGFEFNMKKKLNKNVSGYNIAQFAEQYWYAGDKYCYNINVCNSEHWARKVLLPTAWGDEVELKSKESGRYPKFSCFNT